VAPGGAVGSLLTVGRGQEPDSEVRYFTASSVYYIHRDGIAGEVAVMRPMSDQRLWMLKTRHDNKKLPGTKLS